MRAIRVLQAGVERIQRTLDTVNEVADDYLDHLALSRIDRRFFGGVGVGKVHAAVLDAADRDRCRPQGAPTWLETNAAAVDGKW